MCRQEIFRIKGEHRIDGRRASIEETIFETSHRQTGTVCVARGEWTPTCELHLQRQLGVLKADSPKWESALKSSLSKPREPPATAGIDALYAGQKWP
jgi:hypothetical protein